MNTKLKNNDIITIKCQYCDNGDFIEFLNRKLKKANSADAKRKKERIIFLGFFAISLIATLMMAFLRTTVFAEKFNRDSEEVAGVIVVGTTISLFAIPLLLAWLI